MKTFRLLFSDDMARAIVSGRKTVTRRPVVPHDIFDDFKTLPPIGLKAPCAPGDILIGRECWRRDLFGYEYRASSPHHERSKWRPSIHMPDAAARIRRRVVSVTVERLQDVTIQDAVRAGFPTDRHGGTDARNDFLCAWDDIYINRRLASAVNPWVWRIEFASENEQDVSNGR